MSLRATVVAQTLDAIKIPPQQHHRAGSANIFKTRKNRALILVSYFFLKDLEHCAFHTYIPGFLCSRI